jgi:hypothetical protein
VQVATAAEETTTMIFSQRGWFWLIYMLTLIVLVLYVAR